MMCVRLFLCCIVFAVPLMAEAACRLKSVEQLGNVYNVSIEDSVSLNVLESFSRSYDGKMGILDWEHSLKAIIQERCILIDRMKAKEAGTKTDVTVKFK